MYKKLLKYLFAFSVIGLSLYYLFLLVSKDPDSIINLVSKLPLTILVWAVLFSILGGISNTFVWHRINKQLSPDTKFNVSYFAWSISRIFRYIPGKAFGYIVRQKFQASTIKHGIKSSVNEVLLTFMTILLLSSVYFLSNLNKDYSTYFLILCIALYCLILFSKNISILIETMLAGLNITLQFSRLFNKPNQLFIQSIYGLPALLFHGTSFYLLLKYGFDNHSIDFLYTTVIFYFSGIVGQLSLIAPAGLGVREAALAFFMVNQGYASEIALIAAFGSRVILIVSELINVFISSIIRFIFCHD